MDAGEEKRIGILLVHGIGTQKQGATLSHAGGRFIEWCDRCLDLDSPSKISDSILKPGESNTPAHTKFRLEPSRKDVEPVDVVMAESWWAEQFDPPPFPELFVWLMGNGAVTAMRQISLYIVSPIFYLAGLLFGWHPKKSDGVFAWLMMFPGTVVATLIVFLVQIFLILLFLLWIVPIESTKSIANKLALGLTQVLGDCYVFVSNPVVRASIASRIRHDLDWLEQRSDTVVILAHSQGAAVAFESIKDLSGTKEINLVTYGAGLRKLFADELDWLRPSFVVRVFRYLWLISLLAFAAPFLIWQSLQPMWDVPLKDWEGWYDPNFHISSLVLFGYYLFTWLVCCGVDSHETEVDEKLKQQMAQFLKPLPTRWFDAYATADPVPGGPLIDQWDPDQWKKDGDGIWSLKQLTRFETVKLTNQLSIVSDHTSYWDGFDDFIPRISECLTRWTGCPAFHCCKSEFLGSPSTRAGSRFIRVLMRRTLNSLIVVASLILMVAMWQHWTQSLEVLWTVPPLHSLAKPWPQGESFRAALLSLSVVAVGLVIHIGFAALYAKFFSGALWRVWDNESTRYRTGSIWSDVRGGINLTGFLGSVLVFWFAALQVMNQGDYWALFTVPRDLVTRAIRYLDGSFSHIGIALGSLLAVVAIATLFHRWLARR